MRLTRNALLGLALGLCLAAPAAAQRVASLASLPVEAGGEQRLPAARIRAAVAEYVLARAPTGPQASEVEIAWDRDVILPAGATTLQVRALDASDFTGFVRLAVDFAVDGKVVWTESVPTRVKSYRDVLVVTAPIRRGAPIPPASLEVRRVERSALVGAAFASPEEVAGRRARQMLDVGAVLYANAVDMPPLVRRGSMVNLVIESAQLSISTLGEVKQNASAGESVRVQNLGSGKVVVGVVVDAQTVKVRF